MQAASQLLEHRGREVPRRRRNRVVVRVRPTSTEPVVHVGIGPGRPLDQVLDAGGNQSDDAEEHMIGKGHWTDDRRLAFVDLPLAEFAKRDLDQIVGDLRQFKALGVRHVLMEARYRDLDDMVQIFRTFARDIRPQVAD